MSIDPTSTTSKSPTAPQKMQKVVGRFAPTPSGPLHFGSLIAATASYLNAKSQGGEWRLRIDDIDGPRVAPGACESIVKTLEAYGFEWDGPEVYQSERDAIYQQALDALNESGRLYVCGCSRKQLQKRQPETPWLYDAYCRHDAVKPDVEAMQPEAAWRFQPDGGRLCFDDAVQGPQCLEVAAELGDFVVKRADGVIGYHLACAVDDIEMGMTEVVRGADLLTSSFAQQSIMLALGHEPPHYAHHPLVTNREGIKLSKKSRAPAIRRDEAAETLRAALTFLNHSPPKELNTLIPLWDWAVENWRLLKVKDVVSQKNGLQD
ncbi:tRNA glutamyl-Q(34) synthetase GluQRS [Hydrogenovibrio thermophilus]|nr:tRNA glutamyl-Q(34) synthetase GluQRS [Hydrogenovibrio thermophilus]